ncbi:hypothetical protein [Lachnoclostridium sp. An76]|uniref:hypothetical protein n=1 Tax=Lachnoclostridium sp. An76 TaxID=1965654 RepID=UPI000B3B0869|nr:hypothetical protein [Lachnoclostridium sp. An76]OUN34749.1 hypothetical protein B5G27_08505 [Lachnoclostridium sp. An76]
MILTNLDLCVLALESTHNIKEMKDILPYGLQNKFKWKNGIQIRNAVKRVHKILDESGVLKDYKFHDTMSIIFQPKKVYAFFQKNNIVIQIYISELGKVRFNKVGHETYEIAEIENEEMVLKQYTKVNFMDFYTNILYSENLTKFEKIQKNFLRGHLNDANLENICAICDELENPEYMLVISSYEKGERKVEFIVWNISGDEIRFCCTENKKSNSQVKLGIIKKN